MTVEMPWIVSVDDHVVEPPDLWSSRLPAKYKDVGPRIEYHPAGTPILDGGSYIEAPGHRGQADRVVVLRGPARVGEAAHRGRGLPARRDRHARRHLRRDAPRLLAAEGPRRRHGRQPRRGLAVLPELPALLRPDLPARQGQGARAALRRGLQRLDGRRVGAASPTAASSRCCIVPLWDAELAAAEVRRNAARGVRAVRVQRVPGVARPAVDPLRLLGSVLRGVRRDRHGAARCTSAPAPRRSRTSADAPEGVQAPPASSRTARCR